MTLYTSEGLLYAVRNNLPICPTICDESGAMAGNTIGAILGYGSIPEKYSRPLQLRNLIERMAVEQAK